MLRARTDTNRPLSFAPPRPDPVLPAGTRAGEIGISARASTGRLIVELTAPNPLVTRTFVDPESEEEQGHQH
ncbi:hypothetical protein [Streptomyces sp. NPDC020362]|uniref:hypothetical protein n=1 Tax=unclassified Streptomyces TaxID=2593676 RepID=UPI000A4107E3